MPQPNSIISDFIPLSPVPLARGPHIRHWGPERASTPDPAPLNTTEQLAGASHSRFLTYPSLFQPPHLDDRAGTAGHRHPGSARCCSLGTCLSASEEVVF